MTKFNLKKFFPIFLAFSIVIIVAGFILYGLLGYNTSPDNTRGYAIEVRYSFSLEGEEGDTNSAENKFLDFCESTLDKYDLTYTCDKTEAEALNSSSSAINPTSYFIMRYILSGTDETTVANAEKALAEIRTHITNNSKDAEDETGDPEYLFWGDVSADLHEDVNQPFTEAVWRGAIAIGVGAIVALIYVTIRFGVSCGVAGLVCCAHDALFTAAFFAIARIPLFGAAPILYAAIAAFVSAIVWIVFCTRIRSNYKESEFAGLNAEEVAERTVAASWKQTLIIAATFAAVIVVAGLVAVGGIRTILLPAVLAAVIPAYSTLLIGPCVFAPIRRAFDKKRASKKIRYFGKKKKAETEQEQ